MKIKNTIALLVIFSLTFASILTAGDISLSVYPSEDELYEAYQTGEIDYTTYQKLLEIFQDGVDSTEVFLLKELPNIEFFLENFAKNHSNYEIEQTSHLIKLNEPSKKSTGTVKFTRNQILEEDGHSWGYASIKTKLNENWKFDGKISEYTDGLQTLNHRAMTYISSKGKISKAVIGNYKTQFGLGLMVGYHGRLFNADDESISNTILFPEYGGYNGLYLQGGGKSDEVKFILHYNQNDSLSIRSGGIDLAKKLGYWRFDLMALYSALRNRKLTTEYQSAYFGTAIQYKSKSFNSTAEVIHSPESQTFLPAGIVISKYRTDNFNIGLTLWHYADDYINFSTGSRVGILSNEIPLDSLDYTYDDYRIDQNGILMKTRTILENGTELSLSLQSYGNEKTKIIKDIITAELPIDNRIQFRIDYVGYKKSEKNEDTYENKFRLGLRYKTNQFDYRGYIGYNDNRSGSDYISVFSRASINTGHYGILKGWLNLNRINYDNKQIDYLYCYLKETMDIGSNIAISAKYAYRYSRPNKESRLIVEAKLKW